MPPSSLHLQQLTFSTGIVNALESGSNGGNGTGNGAIPYYDPKENGGAMLDVAANGTAGEPLNVIISGLSDPYVLTDAGFLEFVQEIGFDEECFGLHIGSPQLADLGDGRGPLPQLIEYRQDYAVGGTCWESVVGGNHFRVWKQNGTEANSSALFLAASKEDPFTGDHMIVNDGYNIGRDLIMQAVRSWQGNATDPKWSATVRYVDGLLEPGAEGVNHNISQDGRVALITLLASSTLRSIPLWKSALLLQFLIVGLFLTL